MNTNFFTNFKKMCTYINIRENKLQLFIYFLISVLEALLYAFLPLFSAKIIINITNGVIKQIFLSAIIIFFAESLLYVIKYLKGIFYEKIYQQAITSIQAKLAKEILDIKQIEIDKNTSGIFLERLNKDTAEVATVVMDYMYYLSSSLSNIGILFAIFALNKYLFIYSIFTAVISFVINQKRLNCQYTTYKKLRKLQDSKTSLTSEVVKGIKEIKNLNAKDGILQTIQNSILHTSKKEIEIMNIKRNYILLDNVVKSLSDFFFIIISCMLYSKSKLAIPVFIILYNYQPKIKKLLDGIVEIIEYNKRFNVSANRINELLDSSIFPKENYGTTNLAKLSGNIVFSNVSFGYSEDKMVLKNINLEIKPNQKVAFVGKTGCGKTTIFNLITKLYDVTSGNIYMDGQDLNELTCNSIRNNISVIPQNPYFFNFSIKENLSLLNENISEEKIKEACCLADIDTYIESLQDSYDTVIGENGCMLSGGQKQRLAIARALLKNSSILLLDEATSALDNETQSQINKVIDNLKKDHTILIIAHRLSTILDCDQIFVVDNGKIIASGTHEYLLENCSTYLKLYKKLK